jgi:tRNA G18 (ribose-2'-O)-methylase SpoU
VIHQVSSPDDPAVAPYRQVGNHQSLRARDLFVAEGRLVVERLLASGRYQVQSVLVTPAALAALRARLMPLAAPVLIASPAVLSAITGFDFHRGCLALAAHRSPAALDDVTAGRLLLGLEAVGNPDNVGGLFRTGAAFGIGGVLIDGRTGDPFYRQALRTSMGAVLDMPFASVSDWPVCFEQLRRRGYQVVALTPASSALELSEFVQTDPGDPLILMVGTEGPGLTGGVLESADYCVRIPLATGVDSLNVTVAAAVALARLAEARSSPRSWTRG